MNQPTVTGNPTRRTVSIDPRMPAGYETAHVTSEWASLQSVTLTNTLKDGPRISEVKCYGVSGGEAADQAIATYLYAEGKLKHALASPDPTPQGVILAAEGMSQVLAEVDMLLSKMGLGPAQSIREQIDVALNKWSANNPQKDGAA